MLRVLVIVVILTLATSKPLAPELDEEWRLFKSLYQKKYDPGDEMIRRLIWENNVRYIKKHNLEADSGLHTFTVGMNAFGDMTVEEFSRKVNGYRVNITSKASSSFIPPSNVKLPDTVDWRKEGYVTGVKDQGQCGSCWAFSTTGSLEGQHFKKTGKLVSLSEQNLVDCSFTEGNMGCNGGLMDQAFEYIKTNNGIDNELSYPYEAMDESCKFRVADVSATDTGHTDITKGSESDLMSAVATVGPISVAIDASHQSFQLYKTGVYYEPACSTTALDHGVLAVGYGTEGSQDYWLVKNSWGEVWGTSGYLMMSRNRNNNCGIATQASYPLV